MSAPTKHALVTGASKGIGAAICRRLRADGFEVHALARSGEALDRLAAECGVRPIVADVREADVVAAALDGIDLDVLVNNAGSLASVRPLHEQSAEEIEETVAVNLTAPLLLIRRFLPGMIARGSGHIVNVTSTAGRHVFANTAAYGGAKAGLSHAGSAIRYDLAGTGVRLTEIAPGRVETDFYLSAFAGERQRLKETMYEAVRALKPEDVAVAVALVLALPDHADVSVLELTPTNQATGGHVMRSKEPPASIV